MRHLFLVLIALVLALPAQAKQDAIVEVTSPGGITAWLRQDSSVPLLAIDFRFREATDVPADKAGVQTLAAAMLTEGAGDWDQDAFRQALNDEAIGLSYAAGRDYFSGSLTTLTANRALAVRLLHASLTAPRLGEAALRQNKAALVSSLRRSETQPDAIAYRTWFRLAFPDHPYGRSVRGTAETAAGLEAADVRGFLDRVLTRKDLVIGVAGDITPEALAPLLDRAFGGLPDRAPPSDLPPVPPMPKGMAVVAHPGPQSVVVFGEAGIPRSDPDWYAALVVNQILGGSTFSSRLGEEVREKRGLAYGITTGLAPYRAGPVLLGRTATRSAAVKETVDIIAREWKRLATDGPTADELADAKAYLIGAFPLSLDSTDSIAAVLVDMQSAGLPRDYWAKRPAVIEAVDLATARRVAARLLHADRLLSVVVGTPDGLTNTLGP